MSETVSVRSLWNADAARPISGSPGGQLSVRTIADGNRLVLAKLDSLAGGFDFVTGIPRSGVMFASMIALHLNLPLVSMNDLLIGNYRQGFTQRSRSVTRDARHAGRFRGLIVDDSINIGNTTRKIRVQLAWLKNEGIDLDYLSLYATATSAAAVDRHFELIEQPRVFEWNFLHHSLTRHFALDLDGILCLDGPSENSDDGGRYQTYIANAPLKYRPSVPIGAIVTSRLSKYRQITEQWLAKHGIEYRQLIMLDLESAEKRRELMVHARFKADVYQAIDAMMFVESEEWQAREIAKLTRRPVYWLPGSLFLRS